MLALVLSDIHANLEALNAVLAAAAGQWDELWNLGDMVGYGGSPNEVIETVRPISNYVVRGNHDRVIAGLSSAVNFNPTARAAVQWSHDELTVDNLEWLKSVPQGPLQPDVPGVTLAHGSPLNEDQYILNMRDAWAPLQQMGTAITFIGHTHVQGGFSQKEHDWHELKPRYPNRSGAESWRIELPPGTRHLINPGSVGQPRDSDWRAAFAIYRSGGDGEAMSVTYYRVPYDLASAQGRILMAGLPERLAERLREGR